MIKAINIEKSYNGERVLFGVSLDIADGEFVSIMGESGSGKSTLLSILGGFLDADGGEVLLDGEQILKLNERQLAQIRCTTLGFVFQSYKLIPTLTVRDNLLLPTLLGGKNMGDIKEMLPSFQNNDKTQSREESKNVTNRKNEKYKDENSFEYLQKLIHALGISELLDKFPDQLSGGQCQRVAIARALLYKPKTLILDEPTGALDSEMEKRVMELLGEVNRELGTTIVQVTHSKTVAAYGNRIVYLKDGKIL